MESKFLVLKQYIMDMLCNNDVCNGTCVGMMKSSSKLISIIISLPMHVLY